MLESIDLECTRGERLLFSGLAFAVEAGHCLHVAGENGAGKTSLLRILCGLLPPTHGEIRWGGQDIRRLREDYWQLLAYVGHLNGVKDELTALENVRFAAALAGQPAREVAREARLWILDEPFTALDVRGVAALSTLIGEQLERGGIVVLTTHQEVPMPGRVRRLELHAQAAHA